MRRAFLGLPILLTVGALATAPAAWAKNLCVGASPGCYPTLQAAVDAAHDGDTITLPPGTYAGGVTVDVSVKIFGAGPGRTIIDGGGPVLTLGVPDADTEPTIAIEGVTVTGGHTVGNLLPFRSKGGGIYIPRAAGPSTGATVTIRNSVIRNNSVGSAEIVDPGPGACCPFSDASGGGISNDGTLTLEHVVVSDNRSGPSGGITSNAEGGGILNRAFGTLTIRNSIITRNVAEATPPNGQRADTGGIFVVGGHLELVDSEVTDNVAQLTSAFPSDVEQFANAGGVHIGEDTDSATIRNTTISGNVVSAVNSVGDAAAFSGGLHSDAPLVLRNSTISDNHVIATTAPGSGGDAFGDSGAGELNVEATVANARFTGNTVTATSAGGDAGGGAGASVASNATIVDSLVSRNSMTATAPGHVSVDGGGLVSLDTVTLRNTTVSDNHLTATGASGSAVGGGIANHGCPDCGSPAVLTLVDSAIVGNSLSGSAGIVLQGGGLFTTFPVTLKNTVIAGNLPDDCFGC
jgi:hypothetical protein